MGNLSIHSREKTKLSQKKRIHRNGGEALLELKQDRNIKKTVMMGTHQVKGTTSKAGKSSDYVRNVTETRPKHI
jgi:hypothetical protein